MKAIDYIYERNKDYPNQIALSYFGKKCLCRCGNPTTHLPKWSSSVPHWGHPEASHAPCCDSEDTATLQKQHPNEFNLDGAAR